MRMISSRSASVIGTRRKPRLGTASTVPSVTSAIIASRTGLSEMPSCFASPAAE